MSSASEPLMPPIGTGTQPILEARGIVKRFGRVRALRGVNFAVMPREVVALVGDNGAGKSTLVKALAGVYPPDAGDILLEGKTVRFERTAGGPRGRDRDRLPGPRPRRRARSRVEPLLRPRNHAGWASRTFRVHRQEGDGPKSV